MVRCGDQFIQIKKTHTEGFFLLIYAAKYNHARFSINHEGHMPLKFSFVGLIVWGSVPSPRLTY